MTTFSVGLGSFFEEKREKCDFFVEGWWEFESVMGRGEGAGLKERRWVGSEVVEVMLVELLLRERVGGVEGVVGMWCTVCRRSLVESHIPSCWMRLT